MSYIFYFHELTQDIILLKTFKQLSIKKYAGMMISTTIIWLYTKSCMPLNQFPLKQLLTKKNPYLFQSPLFSSLLILHFRDQLFSWGVYFWKLWCALKHVLRRILYDILKIWWYIFQKYTRHSKKYTPHSKKIPLTKTIDLKNVVSQPSKLDR